MPARSAGRDALRHPPAQTRGVSKSRPAQGSAHAGCGDTRRSGASSGGSFRVVRLTRDQGRPRVVSFVAVSANFACCTSRPRMIVTVLVSDFGFGGGGAWTTGVGTG